ncbi:MAG: hypothetical protein AAF715_26715, partial [Myxococcota bacterium]
APGIVGILAVAGFRIGLDWVSETLVGPGPAAAIPYAPRGNDGATALREERTATGAASPADLSRGRQRPGARPPERFAAVHGARTTATP